MPSEGTSPLTRAELEAENLIKQGAVHLIRELNAQGWSCGAVKIRLRRLIASEVIVASALKECDIEWPDDRVNSCAKEVRERATGTAVRPQLLSDMNE